MDGPDLIAQGEGDDASPRRRRTVIAVVAALVLAGVTAGADQMLQTRESDALLRATATAAATADYAERRVLAVADYSAPALFGADTPPAVRTSLLAVVQREAADLSPSVRSAAADIHAVSVLPWHGDQTRARTDAAAYLDARADLLDAAGKDLDALFSPAPAAALARADARESLLLLIDGADADQRVDAALAGSAP